MKSVPFNQPDAIVVDEDQYILRSDFIYEWTLPVHRGDPAEVLNRIEIKKGFRWDGASVPKVFWRLGFTPDGPHRAAALVHDLLYIYKGKLPESMFLARYAEVDWHSQSGGFNRRDADRMFGKLMKEAQIPSFYRAVMFWFVRIFGWMYWRDGKDELFITFAKFIWAIALLGLLVYHFALRGEIF